MKYKVEFIGDENEKIDIFFAFDEPYEVLGAFLWAEYNVLDQYLEMIDEILAGRKESNELGANLFFGSHGSEKISDKRFISRR